jgi:3-hydroxyisobutyrate dehydrogenase-like beta-hydroxyacid dehydrogenase
MSEKIAVTGMGQMGSGMARRLQDTGLDVVGPMGTAAETDHEGQNRTSRSPG